MSELRLPTFSSAECFTHGLIGMSLHRLSAPYNRKLSLRVVFFGFFPKVSSASKILDVSLPKPDFELDGIKVYKQENDERAALLLADSVRRKFKTDVAVGSSAGVGYGAVAIVWQDGFEIIRSDVYADILKDDAAKIFRRSENAVKKTVRFILERFGT